MRIAVTALAAASLLAGAAVAAPGRGGDKPVPIGAAARTKNGPDPMARPPEDIGSAEDPAPIAGPPARPQPAPADARQGSSPPR